MEALLDGIGILDPAESGRGAENDDVARLEGVHGRLESVEAEEASFGRDVDLTGELVNMIMAQRIYQANAQSIKTEDQVLQTLVNIR